MTGLITAQALGGYVNVRRVVTGHDQNGKAVFVSDVPVEPITASLVPGVEFHRLWGSDTAPTFPDSGTMPSFGTYFPPVGGSASGSSRCRRGAGRAKRLPRH
jgi:hypothetical protein